jgi:predicted Na+-dependent transporter
MSCVIKIEFWHIVILADVIGEILEFGWFRRSHKILVVFSLCVVHEITKGLARYPAQRFLGLSQAQNRRLRTLALLLGEYKSSFYVAEKSEIDFVSDYYYS